jgi:ABC-type sugar transport system permease subunit
MRSHTRRIRDEMKWFSFLVPALLFYLVLFVIPSLSSSYYSFTEWNGLTSKFIGWGNYKEIWESDKLLLALKNTFFYAVMGTILQNFLALILALFLDKGFRTVNILRAMFLLPLVFSPLVIGYIFSYILEPNIGVLNTLLSNLHLADWQRDWLGNPDYGRWMIVLVDVWKSIGFSMVIYLAGLQSVPQDLYEAGDIDGASPWNKFRQITFPLIAVAVTINIVLATIGNLKIFDQIYAMTGGGPGYATHSIATIIFHLGFAESGEWGLGTAMSIVMFLFILVLTIIQVFILRKREVQM